MRLALIGTSPNVSSALLFITSSLGRMKLYSQDPMIHTYLCFTVSAHCFFSLHTVKRVTQKYYMSPCVWQPDLLHVCGCDKQPHPFFISEKEKEGASPQSC